ncbi:NlpC/P60 family protein [Modestobacter sp. NPDC049651]|uniref:NlpC/P60 family protein n=1 Tax=unclassified Modestobacter TaxID=2643866 RepID=UPI0033DFA427
MPAPTAQPAAPRSRAQSPTGRPAAPARRPAAGARTTAPRVTAPRTTAAPRPGTTRTTTTRTATTRTTTTRTATARTSTGRPPGTRPRPAARRRPARRQRTPLRVPLLRFARRAGIVLGAVLTVSAVLAVLVQPPTGAVSSPAATDLTARAQAAATALATDAARYRAALDAAARFDTQVRTARESGDRAAETAATQRQAVGAYASAAYRRSAAQRFPVGTLSVRSPGTAPEALHQQAVADELTQRQDAAVARAAAAAVEAASYTDAAETAATHAAESRQRAAALLTGIRDRVAGLDPAVVTRWAQLGGAGQVSAAQQAANTAALAGWQGYLAQLADAGITPPPAAALADLTALPTGLAPLRTAAGSAVPGVAAAYVAGQTLTVLPAETVVAVSAAFAQLGKAYVAGQTGPTAYDCAGLTADVFTQAGVGLPRTLAGQWQAGTPVSAGELQVGDLVFSTEAGTGLDDVGLYLGGTAVLAASAGQYQVAVRQVADLGTAVRVTTPPASPAPVPPGSQQADCGAPPPPATPVVTKNGAWGGYRNGRIPVEDLCRLGGGQWLRCDAAAAYTAMSDAYRQAFGTPLCITDSYRSYAAQVDAHKRKPRITAVPGTSNHGWGLAVDLCGGINAFGTPQTAWMAANAGQFGWVHPGWAQLTGQNPEPWHWEFGSLD